MRGRHNCRRNEQRRNVAVFEEGGRGRLDKE